MVVPYALLTQVWKFTLGLTRLYIIWTRPIGISGSKSLEGFCLICSTNELTQLAIRFNTCGGAYESGSMLRFGRLKVSYSVFIEGMKSDNSIWAVALSCISKFATSLAWLAEIAKDLSNCFLSLWQLCLATANMPNSSLIIGRSGLDSYYFGKLFFL